jgi:hypothetical protein
VGLHFVRRGGKLLQCGRATFVVLLPALLGRFLPRLGPLATASGLFFGVPSMNDSSEVAVLYPSLMVVKD